MQPHCSIVCADEDVHLIGMRLLEGFGLNEDNTLFYREESEEAVLSSVFHGKACIGFLMAEMFDGLSEFGKQQFRVIMRSAIEDICHLLLLHPDSRDSADSVKQAFLNLGHTPPDKPSSTNSAAPKASPKPGMKKWKPCSIC